MKAVLKRVSLSLSPPCCVQALSSLDCMPRYDIGLRNLGSKQNLHDCHLEPEFGAFHLSRFELPILRTAWSEFRRGNYR